MRVLLVTGSFPPMTCGVGDYTHALAAALSAQEGVAVGVVTSAGAERDPAGRFEVFPVAGSWTRRDLSAVRTVVRSWRPDVVHFQFPTQGYLGNLAWGLPLLLGLGRHRIVQTWHEHVPARWGGWIAAASPTWIEKMRTALAQVLLSLAPGPLVVVRPEFAQRMPRWYRLLPIRRRLRLVPSASSIPRAALSERARADVRERCGAAGKSLLAFFGFFQERKGIDDLLAILDRDRHHLVMVGEANVDDPYQRAVVDRVRAPPLAGHVTLPGFLPPAEAARVLAAADAVVLPYREGAGDFNTTLRAAVLQGTFVLTTSTERRGYDPDRNVYFARPGDLAEMRQALAEHLGRRRAEPSPGVAGPGWREIAERHLEVYRSAASAGGPGARRSRG